MSTEAERQAANVTPPVADATPGRGTTCIATDTTSRTYDLDDYPEFFNRYVDLKADGGKIYFTFDDDSSGSIDEAVAGTAGSATAVANGTTEAVPWFVVDGETISFRLNRKLHRYLHVKAAASTPRLRLRPSSERQARNEER